MRNLEKFVHSKIMLALLCTFIDWSFGMIGGDPAPQLQSFVVVKTGLVPHCGGTIVGPNAVVTAARCLYNFWPMDWIGREHVHVVKGPGDFTETPALRQETVYSCRNYTYHPSFKVEQNGAPFDIAIITSNRFFPRTHILRPCPSEVMPRDHGLFFGMGLGQKNPFELAEILMTTTLDKVLDESTCRKYFEDGEYDIQIDLDKQVCFAKFQSPGCTLSDTDIGGSILNFHPNGKTMCFSGVASFYSSDSTDYSTMVVFAKADYFADWINYNICGQTRCAIS